MPLFWERTYFAQFCVRCFAYICDVFISIPSKVIKALEYRHFFLRVNFLWQGYEVGRASTWSSGSQLNEAEDMKVWG